MDDGHRLQLAHHGGVQEVLQGDKGLVGSHTPQVQLPGGGGPESTLGPLDDLPGLLLALGLPLHHPDLLLLGGDLQNARLELEGAVLVHRQDGGPGAHLHQLHRVSRPGVPGGGRGLRLRGRAADALLRLVEQVPGLGPALVHLLPVQVLPLLQLLQLGQGQVAGRPGLVDDGPGLGLGLLHHLRPLLLQLLPVLPGLGGRLLHLQLEPAGRVPLPLHLLPLLVQLGEHVLEAHVLRVQPGGGLVDDILRQAQPPGDGEGVGLAGDAQHQPVGGGQGVHIELTGGVLHPGGGHGVHL